MKMASPRGGNVRSIQSPVSESRSAAGSGPEIARPENADIYALRMNADTATRCAKDNFVAGAAVTLSRNPIHGQTKHVFINTKAKCGCPATFTS
jgi:hypothetical protein